MKKFEIGKEYFTRSICDSECIFSIKITGRTAKTVSYEYMGESRRSKIRFDDSGEYIQPDRYSMAPTFRAEREVQPEEEAPAAEESAVSVPAEDAAPLQRDHHFPARRQRDGNCNDRPARRMRLRCLLSRGGRNGNRL